MTFRFNGHLIGDMGEYIPKADYAAAVAADPYPRFRRQLLDEGHASGAELDAIDAAVREEIDEAEAFAMSSPPPDAREVARDVYAHDIA
jgi:pyruvate dehydrogenase E1 component alpha subunit